MKLIPLTVTLLVAALSPVNLSAQMALSLSVGSSAHTSEWTSISATATVTGKHFGGRFGFAGIPDAPETMDFKIPHSDYEDTGRKSTTPLLGGDLLLTTNGGRRVVAYVGGGGYFEQNDRILRSNATGWSYRAGDPEFRVLPDGLVGLTLDLGTVDKKTAATVVGIGAEWSYVTGPAAVLRFKF
ncbi:MAG: hypothetical protein ABJB74_09800 [Gemmatimonas sp.]